MKVSVIIPVYNAVRYLAQAVESALNQPETGEVIIVDDGSTDGSYELGKELEQQHDKVRLLTHPDKKRHRAAAARNLGIRHAQCEYISFLDADDYMLPGRFQKDREVFAKNPDADGTYGNVAYIYETERAAELSNRFRSERLLQDSIRPVKPEELFEAYILDKSAFTFPTIVIKRNRISEDLLFDENLHQVQDIDFCLRWALRRRLYPASVDRPIMHIRRHEANTTLNTEESRQFAYLAYRKWYEEMLRNNWSKPVNRQLVRHLLDGISRHPSRVVRFVLKSGHFLYLVAGRPGLLRKIL